MKTSIERITSSLAEWNKGERKNDPQEEAAAERADDVGNMRRESGMLYTSTNVEMRPVPYV